MAYLSACWASFGKSSEMRMPGTLVAIGLNRPRIFWGASGFGSQRSMWLGAPQLKIKITDFALALPSAGPADSARIQSAQKRPNAPNPLMPKKWRRVSPGEAEADGIEACFLEWPESFMVLPGMMPGRVPSKPLSA